MIDIKILKNNRDLVKGSLKNRGISIDIDSLCDHVDRLSKLNASIDSMKNKTKSNTLSRYQLKDLSNNIKALKDQAIKDGDRTHKLLSEIPAILDKSVPKGISDSDNVEIKTHGKINYSNKKSHKDIFLTESTLDFKKSAVLARSKFSTLSGNLAKLERALVSFMMDTHTNHFGFNEVSAPYLVNTESLFGTGQLPKFKDDLFKIEGEDLFLIPTSEVTLTNLYRDSRVDQSELPIKMVMSSPCFRKEAGSYGKKDGGLIRQHQFNKVELVIISNYSDTTDYLGFITKCAETILEELGLPYRTVSVCSGDTGFSATKTYDLEVWMPSIGNYVEISSCSSFNDFQSRRSNIRSTDNGRRSTFCKTFNGSGLAIGRTIAAIMENCYYGDNKVEIPVVLRPYMGNIGCLK